MRTTERWDCDSSDPPKSGGSGIRSILDGAAQVEVVDILPHQPSQVTLTENDDVIQALTSDTAHEALTSRISFRRTHRCLEDLNIAHKNEKCVPNFWSLSRIKNRGPASNGVALRHCCATQTSLGDRVTPK